MIRDHGQRIYPAPGTLALLLGLFALCGSMALAEAGGKHRRGPGRSVREDRRNDSRRAARQSSAGRSVSPSRRDLPVFGVRKHLGRKHNYDDFVNGLAEEVRSGQLRPYAVSTAQDYSADQALAYFLRQFRKIFGAQPATVSHPQFNEVVAGTAQILAAELLRAPGYEAQHVLPWRSKVKEALVHPARLPVVLTALVQEGTGPRTHFALRLGDLLINMRDGGFITREGELLNPTSSAPDFVLAKNARDAIGDVARETRNVLTEVFLEELEQCTERTILSGELIRAATKQLREDALPGPCPSLNELGQYDLIDATTTALAPLRHSATVIFKQFESTPLLHNIAAAGDVRYTSAEQLVEGGVPRDVIREEWQEIATATEELKAAWQAYRTRMLGRAFRDLNTPP